MSENTKFSSYSSWFIWEQWSNVHEYLKNWKNLSPAWKTGCIRTWYLQDLWKILLVYITNFGVKRKHYNSNINLLSSRQWEVFCGKKNVLKSFIKILKITCEVRPFLGKIKSSKTKFLKTSYLFLYTLYRYFFKFLSKVI